MNSDIVQTLVENAIKDNLSHKVVKDAMSIIRNIMKDTQYKYKLTDISYLDDIVIPKKVTTREDVKVKRAGYMKRSFIMTATAYIMEFQSLNGMRIGELLAIQPYNIDFDNKTLEIDVTIHWRNEGNAVEFKYTTKTESYYRSISLTTGSCDILRKVMLENKKAI